MDKEYESYNFILGWDSLTHRHPEFTSGSHEIGEDYLVEETCETH